MTKKVTLRDLFSEFTEEQLSQVAEVLDGYFEVSWRIYERLGRERPEIIDDLVRSRKMKAKVDSSNIC